VESFQPIPILYISANCIVERTTRGKFKLVPGVVHLAIKLGGKREILQARSTPPRELRRGDGGLGVI
jgi:hypothetical protein